MNIVKRLDINKGHAVTCASGFMLSLLAVGSAQASITIADAPEFLYTGEGKFVRGPGDEGIGGRQHWQRLR